MRRRRFRRDMTFDCGERRFDAICIPQPVQWLASVEAG
jgi:hypothetical protein